MCSSASTAKRYHDHDVVWRRNSNGRIDDIVIDRIVKLVVTTFTKHQYAGANSFGTNSFIVAAATSESIIFLYCVGIERVASSAKF